LVDVSLDLLSKAVFHGRLTPPWRFSALNFGYVRARVLVANDLKVGETEGASNDSIGRHIQRLLLRDRKADVPI